MKGGNAETTVLRKMYTHGYIGKRHTSLDNLQKGFPKHERGSVGKAVAKLVKKNYIVMKSTGYGQHCSLNTKRIMEILARIDEPARDT